jgi:hypothetical protein
MITPVCKEISLVFSSSTFFFISFVVMHGLSIPRDGSFIYASAVLCGLADSVVNRTVNRDQIDALYTSIMTVSFTKLCQVRVVLS